MTKLEGSCLARGRGKEGTSVGGMFDHMNRNRKQQNSFCGTSSTLHTHLGLRRLQSREANTAKRAPSCAEAISPPRCTLRFAMGSTRKEQQRSTRTAHNESLRAAFRPFRSSALPPARLWQLSRGATTSSPTPNATVTTFRPLPYGPPNITTHFPALNYRWRERREGGGGEGESRRRS